MTDKLAPTTISRLLHFVSRQPLSLSRWAARVLAAFLNVFQLSKTSQVIRLNLNIALPHLDTTQREQLARQAIRNELTSYFEFFNIWGAENHKNISRIHQVHGEQLLHEALAAQKGVVLIVPHFGTWELMNAWVNLHTAPVIMYKPSKNPDVNRFMLEARQRLNATLVPTDETGVRALFKHLKQGGFAAILPDHVPKESGGIYSPFFGQNALSSTLLSKLAAKTQCSVIGLSCLRREDLSGFELHVQTLSAEINAKDLQLSVDTLNKEMERMIHVAPEQYLWSYKRFRNLEGTPSNLYK